jgi:hypothetical protein
VEINWIGLATSAAAPTLALVGKFLFSDRESSSLRQMKKHAQLLESLPGDASAHIESMLSVEAQSYASARMRRVRRKLEGGTLAALIFVGIITASLTWLLVWAATNFWFGWWFIAVGAALFGALLMAVGTGQLWKYPEDPSQDT